MLKNKLKPQIGHKSLILIIVSVILFEADIITKFLEEKFAWNSGGPVLGGLVDIRSERNMGCAFSFLDDNPEIGQPILITFTFVLLIFMILAFIFIPERFTLLKVAISIIVAGAVGNLVDRLALGCVRDWFGLKMPMFDHNWNFGFGIAYCNLADFWIVIGAGIVVLDILFLKELAVLPLTKKTKAAPKARKAEEERGQAGNKPVISESESHNADTEEGND